MPQQFTSFIGTGLLPGPDECGLGRVAVVRTKRPDRIEVGLFLIDGYCLGVRDAVFEVFDAVRFKEFREESLAEMIEKDGAWGRKYVESAVSFARALGFAPHRDYKKAARVFGGIRAADCTETFTFGKEGKPYYVPGVDDDEVTIERVIARLRTRCGTGGFGFESVFDMEEDEVAPLFWAEQSDGGPPCAALEAMKTALTGELQLTDEDAIGYDGDISEVAEVLKLFIQSLCDGIGEALANDPEHRPWSEEIDENAVRMLATGIVLTLATLRSEEDESERNKLLAEAQLDPQQAEFVLASLEDDEIGKILNLLHQPSEYTTRHLVRVEWDEGEPSRLLVIYAEVD